jgi:hypothetical protein
MRRKDDILLKGAFEETFPDLLEFVFGGTSEIFDLDKGIEFLDKELAELFPDLENNGGSRFVDLLAKVYLKSGAEKWILVHVEIQANHDPGFGLRMFQYFYRIFDKHHVPVTALAVFTGEQKSACARYYNYEYLGTSLNYAFNAFHVMDFDEKMLLSMRNRFALVVLAAQKVVKGSKISMRQLAECRLLIAKNMFESEHYSPEQINYLLYFLKRFLYINDKEINAKLESEIKYLTGSNGTMGILDAVKTIAFMEGEEKARGKIITKLLKETSLEIAQIASIADVDVSLVISIQSKLKAKSPS